MLCSEWSGWFVWVVVLLGVEPNVVPVMVHLELSSSSSGRGEGGSNNGCFVCC